MGDGFDGGGSGFDLSGLFDSLLGTLVDFINALLAFLQSFVAAVANALNFLFAGEVGIFGFAQGIGEAIHSILHFIVDTIFKAWVFRGFAHLLDLFRKLQGWIKKLKQWLDKLRRIQQLSQGQALRRVINLIQRIRQVLVIFRILHLRFASKLDNWLSGIEGSIIRHFLFFQSKTNEIIGVLDFLFTATGALAHFPLFLALLKHPDTFLKVMTGGGLAFWYSGRPSDALRLLGALGNAEHYAELRSQARTNTGQVSAWRDSFEFTRAMYPPAR